jgi:hypothetical protein
MKKLLALLLLVFLFSCEKGVTLPEPNLIISGTKWGMYSEQVKEERVGVDGTIRERATYWDCKKTAFGEECTLVTIKDQWNDYKDDDVVHDVVFKTTGSIEFTEKTVTLHLKRSYITVFGEFIIEDINTEDEYSFNGLSGQTISGDSFRIINDGLLLWFNGNNYTRQ